MMSWKSLLIIGLSFYLGVVTLMYLTQRAMMYFPETLHVAPAAAGLAQAEEVVLATADGERVIAWHVPPKDDGWVFLYFHGNGGSLRYRADRFGKLAASGAGLVALSYRGYGGSTGSPTEAGILADAAAAYAFAAARYPASRIVLWGESLGGGVAMALAAEKPVARLVLEAPFSSAADVGASAYPFLPVRLLMKDQFRSDLHAAKVSAPVLIMHGERDGVVPIALGEKLYALLKEPKRFVRFPAGGHNDLGAHGAIETVRAFLAEKFE